MIYNVNPKQIIEIGQKQLGIDQPTFIIAELSGNHHLNYAEAEALVQAAAAGADAVKSQTYTADTITLKSDKEWFRVKGKDQPEIWKGRTLYDLYQKKINAAAWASSDMTSYSRLQLLSDDEILILFDAAGVCTFRFFRFSFFLQDLQGCCKKFQLHLVCAR